MDKIRIIETLRKWNFWDRELAIGVERNYTPYLLKFMGKGKIVSIIGVRRAGKSYILRQLIQKIKDKERTLMINFEDPEFEDYSVKDMQKIYEAYQEMLAPQQKPFIFLDEIQNVPRWEKFVRSLQERDEANIILSGSSSKLLSQELATVLAGRQLYFEILPLDFREFLKFKGLEVKTEKDIAFNVERIRKYCLEYMQYGSFPEIVLAKDPDFKLKIIRSYYNDLLLKDIIERFGVEKVDKLRALAKFYLTNNSSLITYNGLSKFLKFPTETIRRYTEYLKTSRCLFFLPRFSFSLKQQENSPRKVYSIDPYLSISLGFNFSKNYGKILENLVAIELLRRKSFSPSLELYYWQEHQREVDFVIKEGLRVKEVIQACWDPSNEKTKQRETKALLTSMKRFKLKKGLIITGDYEAEEEFKGKKIIYKPLWKFLLEK